MDWVGCGVVVICVGCGDGLCGDCVFYFVVVDGKVGDFV